MTNHFTKADSVAIRILKDGRHEAITVPRHAKVLVAEDSIATVPLVEVEWHSEKLLMFAHELLKSEELEQAVGDGRRSDEERFEELAFTMAHDLQAPLRSIGTVTELFLKRIPAKLDNESVALLEYVVKGVERMRQLIRDMLDLATATTGVEVGEVDSHAVAEMAVDNLRQAVEESGASITIDPMPMINAHKGQLLRVFQNLVGNAIKYRRVEHPVIRISAVVNDSDCIFSVQDNGIGIDPKYHEQIFETFRRLHSEGRREGSGVGLSIVKKIIEWHKGRIWVESEPGGGSIFYFSIPVAEAADMDTPSRMGSDSYRPDESRRHAASQSAPLRQRQPSATL